MMYQQGQFKYAETDKLQILELPYKGDDLSMVLLLPKQVDGLAELEKSLTLENLNDLLGKLRKQKVEVYIPKFKMTSEFSLARLLADMGMPDAFSRKADFSGMNGTLDLFISAVLHKAFVEVNEEGTEAAAATAVVMKLKGAASAAPVFRADHPFVFTIKDIHSGSILFIGRIMNPVKSE